MGLKSTSTRPSWLKTTTVLVMNQRSWTDAVRTVLFSCLS